DQPWDTYTDTDHSVWAQLFERQCAILPGRASDEFLSALSAMEMTPDRIPKFTDLNPILRAATGWELIGVEGLLPELTFFDHLANRRFPVTWWIRKPDQMDYLSEPDLFHDLFGHVPLLMNPVFADYMEAYGRGGVKAHGIGEDALVNLTRLYWYTVEFGLIRQKDGLRIYGSGIVSSKGESMYSLESDAPNRIGFDLERIMRTRYRIDTYQKTYFVIDSFEQLMDATGPDFAPIYEKLARLESVPAGDVLEGDRVYNRGTGEGWLNDGDV
ncbi:MAG: phenylalanine 4-monooxygenase, partial [Lysobacter spongiicola]|nr:phenylalanine 4-monooxygenase [Lysobacter spongiicola]